MRAGMNVLIDAECAFPQMVPLCPAETPHSMPKLIISTFLQSGGTERGIFTVHLGVFRAVSNDPTFDWKFANRGSCNFFGGVVGDGIVAQNVRIDGAFGRFSSPLE